MDQDRGHLMAYSLGAPKTMLIMVPQPRSMNQSVAVTSAFPAELDWRGTEIFLASAAQKIMNIQEDGVLACCFSSWRGENIANSLFQQKVNITGAGAYKRVNGEALDLPPATTMSIVTEPKFHLRYEIEISDFDSQATPRSAALTVHLCDRDGNSNQVLANTFQWEDSPAEQDRRLDQLEIRAEKKEQASRDSISYKREHPTRSAT